MDNQKEPRILSQTPNNINDMKSIMNSIILCQLMEGIVGLLDVTETHQKCINVVTGMNLSLADVKRAGERI